MSAFFVYRKVNEDGEYERAKILGPTKLEFKETKTLTYGNWYYYRVVAYYEDIDCYSAPARCMYGNEYFVKVHYSQDGVDEVETQSIEVYPNPAKDILTVKAENLSSVAVYNSIGQRVLEQELNGDETTINTSDFNAGIYMVRIVANGNEITRKISVVK